MKKGEFTMRTIVIEHNVYKYDELSENAKRQVKEWYLNNQDPYIFTEDCKMDLENLFGKNDLHIQYSLNSCQGDGFNIYGLINTEDIVNCLENQNGGTQLKRFENVLTEEEKKTILTYAKEVGECAIIELPWNNRYCYSLANRINFAEDWKCELEYYSNNINKALVEKFENLVQEIFIELCGNYEKQGYEYFYEISEEDLRDICDGNEWEFLEDGTFYN